MQALEAEFDFIFLGIGLGAMQRLGIPGEESEGVMNALELIAAYKTGRIRELTGTVVVVGAGNTAIDAANAARRLGAETVYLLYRRGESDMSAFDFEYEHAKTGRRAVSLAPPARRHSQERGTACCSIPCRCSEDGPSAAADSRLAILPSPATSLCRPSASRRIAQLMRELLQR